MRLLAVDTSSDACSVAFTDGAGIAEKHVVEARSHTTILMPMIRAVLGERPLAGLDAIVLGVGPGSFIGIRIGASVVQGLCHAAGLQVVPVSSLAALAVEVFDSGENDRVVVAQDARMNEVYVGQYARGPSGLPEALEAESIQPAGKLNLAQGQADFAGAAWDRYPELLAANENCLGRRHEFLYPRAGCLLRIAAAGAPAIAPDRLQPAYLRSRVAEIPVQQT